MRVNCAVAAMFLCVMVAHTAWGKQGAARKLRRMTGFKDVRIVFTRSEDDILGFPNQGISSNDYLARYDAESDEVDTLIKVQGNYQHPIINRDGTKIVYSQFPAFDAQGTIYVVDWEGDGTPRRLARGSAACFWYDEVNQKEYVVYAFGCSMKESCRISRVNIDDSTDVTTVMNIPSNLLVVGHWLSVSSDLKTVGGVWGWPNVAAYDVATGLPVITGQYGCWGTMPYDTSGRLLYLEPEHKGWRVCTRDNQCDERFFGPVVNHFKIASYSRNIVLITLRAGVNNKAGDIAVFQFSDSLKGFLDSVTVTFDLRDGFADLWAGGDPSTPIKIAPRTPVTAAVPFRNTGARMFTIRGTVAGPGSGNRPSLPGVYFTFPATGTADRHAVGFRRRSSFVTDQLREAGK